MTTFEEEKNVQCNKTNKILLGINEDCKCSTNSSYCPHNPEVCIDIYFICIVYAYCFNFYIIIMFVCNAYSPKIVPD